uniref:Uncharacterized protein n=1 Tax=Vespula pensylvanica TaxID=30213 RepID=A0A834KUQ3_VESPE|nr:hypothetical protein H0235_013159 [Vespula pensylvanica]
MLLLIVDIILVFGVVGGFQTLLQLGTSGYVVSAVLVLIVGALLAILATVSHHLHHRRLEPLHESNSASILHHHRHLHHHHQRHHQHHHQQQRQQQQQQQQQQQEQEQQQQQRQRQRQHHRRHQENREESSPALHQQHSFLQDHHRHPGTQERWYAKVERFPHPVVPPLPSANARPTPCFLFFSYSSSPRQWYADYCYCRLLRKLDYGANLRTCFTLANSRLRNGLTSTTSKASEVGAWRRKKKGG